MFWASAFCGPFPYVSGAATLGGAPAPVLAVSADLLTALLVVLALGAIALVFFGARGAFLSGIRAGKKPSRARAAFHRTVWPVIGFIVIAVVVVAWWREAVFYGLLKLG